MRSPPPCSVPGSTPRRRQRRRGRGTGAPRARADDPNAVDLLLDAFAALTGDYERAVPLCRAAVHRLHMDMRAAGAELRWYWHGAVLALELWDDHGAYHLPDHHTRAARNAGALSQLALALSSHTPVLVFRGDISAAESAVGEAESVQEATSIQGAPYGALIVTGLARPGASDQGPCRRDCPRGNHPRRGDRCRGRRVRGAVLCNSLGQYEEALRAAIHATESPPSSSPTTGAWASSSRRAYAGQLTWRAGPPPTSPQSAGKWHALGPRHRGAVRAPCSTKVTKPKARTASPSPT